MPTKNHYPDKDDLKYLRSQLQWGDIQRIANRLGLHRSTINKVFKNQTRNFEVIGEAVAIISQRRGLMKKIRQQG